MLTLNNQETFYFETPRDIEQASAEDVLQWAFEKFSPNIALACSFQAEGSVLIDMLHQLRGSDFRVFTLDTGRLNQETYDCMETLRQRYGIAIEVYFPAADMVEQMVKAHGLNLFYESMELRKHCCEVRKVEPLKRALKGLTAWATGLRREQTGTRTAAGKVELDGVHGGILKINPLADWTHKQVWDYIAAHDVPYNKLHDRGFPSIGCAPCTRAIKPWEESRAGRWWWEKAEQKECGLHVSNDHGPATAKAELELGKRKIRELDFPGRKPDELLSNLSRHDAAALPGDWRGSSGGAQDCQSTGSRRGGDGA